jgi:hypothetical protein
LLSPTVYAYCSPVSGDSTVYVIDELAPEDRSIDRDDMHTAAGPTRQILLLPRPDLGSVEAVAYLHGGRDIVVLSEAPDSAITRRPGHILRERPPS